MKDKHRSIAADTALLRQLHAAVSAGIPIRRRRTALLLLLKFGCYFTGMMLAYGTLLWSGSAAVQITAYIAYGLLSVLLGFNFAHDFCHRTVFRNRRLNDYCFIAVYTLLGAHAEAWKYRHIHSHHYAPNVPDYDSDLQITSLIRVVPDSPYHWYHRYQHWYAPVAYATYSLYWVFIKDFVIFTAGGHPAQHTWRFRASFWLQKACYLGYLLVLPLCLAPSWLYVVAGFLIMHAIQSLFLLFTFFMTHHVEATAYFHTDADGCIAASWLANQVGSSNDFYPFSRMANFIFGGFNNHIAHHLFPHVHHVHYPALNRILYRMLQEQDIQPNVTSYMGGVRSHLRHLKKMSHNSRNNGASAQGQTNTVPAK